MIPRKLILNLIWMTFGASVVLAIVFTIFPNLDLPVSRLVFRNQDGFWLSKVYIWEAVRNTIWTFCDACMIATVILLIINLIRPTWTIIYTRSLLFVVSAYVIGPGLISNGLLKTYWGRARPRDITEFGGDLIYSAPLKISDQCARSCSFVSGEASVVVLTSFVLFLLTAPYLHGLRRVLFFTYLLAISVIASLLRVATGGHFLSDVLFAAVLMILVSLLLYLAFGLHKPGVRLSPFLRRDLSHH